MADTTLSSDMDAFLVTANDAAARTELGALGGSLGATDNAILRADGTGSKTAQGSTTTMGDDGAITTADGAVFGKQTAGPSVYYDGGRLGFVNGQYYMGLSAMGLIGVDLLVLGGILKVSVTGDATKYASLSHDGTNALLNASSGSLLISTLPTSNPGPGILWNNLGIPAIGT